MIGIVQGSEQMRSDGKFQNIDLKSLILIFAATELIVKSVWVRLDRCVRYSGGNEITT